MLDHHNNFPYCLDHHHPIIIYHDVIISLDQHVLVTRENDEEETADRRVRNREAIKNIRETCIYKPVHAQQDEFTQSRKVRTIGDDDSVGSYPEDEIAMVKSGEATISSNILGERAKRGTRVDSISHIVLYS